MYAKERVEALEQLVSCLQAARLLVAPRQKEAHANAHAPASAPAQQPQPPQQQPQSQLAR
ncbi:hypothetical protein PLESTF_000619300 [Pleodorina starrii]|nr:hypothetical protein PLESTM_001000700 [Pleodorina starrii]GLC67887.1 hypothetical protein PLESTF_000619300 [Pleodorina starrii]